MAETLSRLSYASFSSAVSIGNYICNLVTAVKIIDCYLKSFQISRQHAADTKEA